MYVGKWAIFNSNRMDTRGPNGYARIDVRFPDKNDKLVQTRYKTRARESVCLGFDSKWLLFQLFSITSKA